MNEKTFAKLDFDRVRESAAAYCFTEEGAESLRSSQPLTETEAVGRLIAKVRSVHALMVSGEETPDLSFPSIALPMKRLAKDGMSLELEEFYALGLWAESYARYVKYMGKAENAEIRELVSGCPDLSAVVAIAFRLVNKDGSLKDLPELREAMRRIRSVNDDLQRITQAYFRDEGLKSALQSDAPTMRDGRTVLAVRAGQKARIRGIVHEVSQTGQTVFIEPEDLVLKNNELVEAESRYRQELARILRESTEKLRPSLESLAVAVPLCALLDGIYARARKAKSDGAVFALNCERGFLLARARHPSLGARAVPIDIELGDDDRVVIITGPNTGGKTVALKTVGLFALMNQFGLGLPASEGTRLPVFASIWADIGDEQSIDQSLSTFSGHMTAIAALMEGAGRDSLVLLDELGSGTDPEEGGAIAMALLDRIIEKGPVTLLTTHHGILKNYGYTRPGVVNASVDFDGKTLSPTYRILMGVPGESHALDIALRNGLDAKVVEGARLYLDEERADISTLIKGLRDKHRLLDDLESESRTRVKKAMEDQRKVDLKELRLKQREGELRAQGLADLKRMLHESRSLLENLVRELKEGELTREKTLQVKDFLNRLEAQVADEEKKYQEEHGPAPLTVPVEGAASAFGEGSPVLCGSARIRGRIIRRAKPGYWVVEAGSLKLTFHESELVPAKDEVAKPAYQVELTSSASSRASIEVDVRGYRLQEALDRINEQLDAAALSGLSFFSIIHGTGEGVLGKGIHGLLKKNPMVADYHFARPEDGGYGKTIVTLK